MQALAAWLVARPQNAVIALAATLLLPVLQIVSGVIMVLLVLGQGPRLAIVEAAIAGGLLLVVALVGGGPVEQVVGAAAGTWLPALLFAVVLIWKRSLTLTLQLSALLAAGAALAFYVAVEDLVAYWQPVLTMMQEWAQTNELYEQARLMDQQPALTANMLTMAFVLASWMLYAVYLLLGYWLFTRIPGENRRYGRFCDLDFGRVVALIMAVLSLLALVVGAAWLQGIAFVLFAVFWLQGLAVLHWMHADGHLPLFVVIVTYVLLPVLHVFLVTALAVLGYVDAWFRFRRRTSGQGK
jgi:hypothetical protein